MKNVIIYNFNKRLLIKEQRTESSKFNIKIISAIACSFLHKPNINKLENIKNYNNFTKKRRRRNIFPEDNKEGFLITRTYCDGKETGK